MTSREIAELTDNRHDNVMADIRKMLVELYGEGGVLTFQDTHVNTQNSQTYPIFKLDELKKDDPNLDHPLEDKDSRGYTICFHLNRELTETLLTGYSASARL